MGESETHRHVIPYQTYFRVWLLLLALTAVLVVVSRLFHQLLSVWAMLVLTPIKAALVFFFFMHLKYEKLYLRALVFFTLALLTMVIGILFLDIFYR
jgi:cytochrome c oxidase subunit IV